MKHVLVHLNLHGNTKSFNDDNLDIDWSSRENPHSILVPAFGHILPLIKTETHDVDPLELLTPDQNTIMDTEDTDTVYGHFEYIDHAGGDPFEQLITYIENHIDRNIITINLGISTHPPLDFNGTDLAVWVRRIQHKFSDKFDRIKWRFANTWDIYGHLLDKWLPWFLESISPISNNNILIEVASYDVARAIALPLPGADVRFNTVYFKRILRSNILNNIPAVKINTKLRNKHAVCLNHYRKEHRTKTVNHIIEQCDVDKFHLSYISEGIHLEDEKQTLNFKIAEWQDTPPTEIIEDAYVNIVAETYFNEYRDYSFDKIKNIKEKMLPFLTEKSFKCAYYYQPMLMVGMKDSLKVWRALGFKSFPEFFDESYDECADDDTRLSMVLEEILKIQSMPIEELHSIYHSPTMIEKLKHNKSVFNKFVRDDPLMQWAPLHKLYKKGSQHIGLNPHLDEIYLDK
jgi:hypothetical protein